MKPKQTIVISLGGSLIYPQSIDVDFLKRFKRLVSDYVKKENARIIIVTGGGKLARIYNEAARSLYKDVTAKELDWMGTKVTKVNAELVRIMFNSLAYYKVLDRPDEKLDREKNAKVLVAGGWKPGASSDNMAVRLATTFKADTVINLTNTDYVYTRDPKKYKSARPLKEVSWKEFRKLVGNKWNPGLHTPFDPIASKYAHKNKLTVAILNGQNISNLRSYLRGEKFIGTEIR